MIFVFQAFLLLFSNVSWAVTYPTDTLGKHHLCIASPQSSYVTGDTLSAFPNCNSGYAFIHLPTYQSEISALTPPPAPVVPVVAAPVCLETVLTKKDIDFFVQFLWGFGASLIIFIMIRESFQA